MTLNGPVSSRKSSLTTIFIIDKTPRAEDLIMKSALLKYIFHLIMAKRDAGKALLADTLGEDNSFNEINYENDESIESVLSDGESLFCKLLIDSSDGINIYGQPRAQDRDDRRGDVKATNNHPGNRGSKHSSLMVALNAIQDQN